MAIQDAPALINGSAAEFDARTDPFRRELLVHCYRMLGSIDDAEDAVQDVLVRAWRGRDTYRQAISLRAWLYRIATNVCLDAIARRARTPESVERLDIGPIPDDLLDEASAGPEARYDASESISLAFLTALQLLPPRQRAVLILRDVLAWRASEVAGLLELSVPAVNSALQRARTTLATHYRSERGTLQADPGGLKALLERYVRAWETADVSGLVALLREDAIVSMPPAVFLTGRTMIRTFLAETVLVGGRRIRLLPIGANRMPAFAIYSGDASEPALRAVRCRPPRRRWWADRPDERLRRPGGGREVQAAWADRGLTVGRSGALAPEGDPRPDRERDVERREQDQVPGREAGQHEAGEEDRDGEPDRHADDEDLAIFVAGGDEVEDRQEDDRHARDPDPDLGRLGQPEDRQRDVRHEQQGDTESEDVDGVDEDAASGTAHGCSLGCEWLTPIQPGGGPKLFGARSSGRAGRPRRCRGPR